MELNIPYLTIQTKLRMYQKWILVHSYLYYELDKTIVSDSAYDNNMKELKRCMDKYPRESKSSTYYYAFKDFEPSSGFYLISKLDEYDKHYISEEAQRVLITYKKLKGKR